MMDEPLTSSPTPGDNATVELHIEELILDGFSPHDRFRIRQAIEMELSRLLHENGVPKSWSAGMELGDLDGGSFQVTQNSHPESVGTRVAQAVYGDLKK